MVLKNNGGPTQAVTPLVQFGPYAVFHPRAGPGDVLLMEVIATAQTK